VGGELEVHRAGEAMEIIYYGHDGPSDAGRGAAARGGDERVEGLVVVSAITSQVPGAKTE
jgi:hypothetical protein